jgi:hypothetical protein
MLDLNFTARHPNLEIVCEENYLWIHSSSFRREKSIFCESWNFDSLAESGN